MIDFFKNAYAWAVGVFGVFVAWLVAVVEKLGYAGIFVFMTLESTFVPLPSEVVIPPAGYLTALGRMNIIIVILMGVLGSMAGASINYLIAYKYGRKFMYKYAKYFFLTEERLAGIDAYFCKHGEITTFVGRLIIGVRHYISFPAGLAKMHFGKFLFYTAFGAAVWVTILAIIGRMVGNNIELVREHMHTVVIILIPALILLVAAYIIIRKYVEKRSVKKENGAECD